MRFQIPREQGCGWLHSKRETENGWSFVFGCDHQVMTGASAAVFGFSVQPAENARMLSLKTVVQYRIAGYGCVIPIHHPLRDCWLRARLPMHSAKNDAGITQKSQSWTNHELEMFRKGLSLQFPLVVQSRCYNFFIDGGKDEACILEI